MKYFVFFVFLSFSGIAQDSSSVYLSPVVVTANIQSADLKSIGRNLIIIDNKTIAAAPVKSLDAILQYALNVDVRSRSSFGVQADVSIRGGNFDQTLFLIDGIKVNDPQTGHHSLNIPISIDQIDHIEILLGGASCVYGPNAFSGAINIITKKINKSSLSLTKIIGENALNGLIINANYFKKGYYAGINFDKSKSNGFAYNTAYDKTVWSSNFGKNLKSGSLDFMLGLNFNSFGAANFYSPKVYDQSEAIRSRFANLTWKHTYSNSLSSTFNINYRRHYDKYDFNNYEKNNRNDLLNLHKTNVFDVDWKLKSINKWGKSSFGLEYRSEYILSNRLGDLIANPVSTGFSGVFYTKAKQRDNLSLFFEHQFKFEKLNMVLGNLVNHNSQYGTAFYPGIDFNYSLSENHKLYSSLNRSLRYPTFTELYLVSSTLISDPNLKPEKAWTYEIGQKFTKRNFSSSMAVFYRQTTDAIDKVKYPTVAVPMMVNINNINMFGFEWANIFSFNAAQNLKSINFNYAYLKADRHENGFQSFYTLNYLRHKFSGGINLSIIKNLNLNVLYTYKLRMGSYQWDAATPAVAYKPVKLVDARLAYTFRQQRIFLDINNAFDYQYFEFGFVKQPGRWVSAGISLKL